MGEAVMTENQAKQMILAKIQKEHSRNLDTLRAIIRRDNQGMLDTLMGRILEDAVTKAFQLGRLSRSAELATSKPAPAQAPMSKKQIVMKAIAQRMKKK